jgi:hypothetical protein
MSTSTEYVAGSERPALVVQLLDDDGAVIDLTGYTCSLKIGDPTTTVLTKTAGVVGSASGITVTWSASELAIQPATYLGEAIATSGGLDYRRQFSITITPALP